MKIRYTTKFITILLSVLASNISIAQREGINPSQTKDTVTLLQKSTFKNIGFDIQPTHHITSAISTVSGSDLEKNFSLNLGNTLFGRIAGLSVTQGGSEPGASTPNLFVRGMNTFGSANTAPLYIIDGFISNGSGASNGFMQLLPEEIESISVLKDAAAIAVYGSRAANGVILVTTNTGKEGALKISFTTRQGFNQAQYVPEFLNAYNYSVLYNEALSNDGLPTRYSTTDLESYQNGSDPIFHPDIDWYDQVLRKTAPVSSYNLSFSGGDKFMKYFVVLNAIKSDGLFKKFGEMSAESSNSNYSKYNFRTNLDVTLSKRLSAEFKIAGSIEQSNNSNNYNTGGTFGLLTQLPPNAFPVYNPDKTFGGTSLYSNPVANLLATGFYQSNSRTILSSLKLTEQLDFITDGLSVSGAVSINNYFRSGSRKTKQYPRYAISKGVLGDTLYSPSIGQLTSLSGGEETLDQYRNTIIQAFLNYNRTFGKNNVTGMLMFNTDQVTFFGPSGDISNPSANSTDPYNHNGGAGRLTFVHDNKYILECSFGYMGSEVFAPEKRYGFFPSASFGWIASGEEFLKNNKSINFLKVRGSYGLVGNDIISTQGLGNRYAFTETFGGSGYFFGTGNIAVSGFAENTIANPNITWEKEKTMNLGIDAIFFKNFNVSIDYFNRNRYDILVASNSTTPAFLGIATPSLNQGKTNNQGLDLSLSYKNDSKKSLQFFAEANFSYFKNKVIFNAEPLQFNTQLYSTGASIGQPYGLKAIGFYSVDDIAQRLIDPKRVPGVLTEVIKMGDIKYQDFGGPEGKPDGIIDGNDRLAIGNPGLPNVSIGFNSGIRYKGFDLNVVFQAVRNNTVYLGGNTFHAFQNNGQIAPIALNRWTPETASTADYPRLSSKDNLNNYQLSSFWQHDGSFIKLRSAEIGYNLPTLLTSKVKVSNIRIFVTGTNLFSIDKIEYGDPEALSGYPVMRTITLGLKINL